MGAPTERASTSGCGQPVNWRRGMRSQIRADPNAHDQRAPQSLTASVGGGDMGTNPAPSQDSDARVTMRPEGRPARSSTRLDLVGSHRRYRRNHPIFREEEAPDYFYQIVSGTVRICRSLRDGARQIGAFRSAGDTFGIDIADLRTVCAEAVTDCEVIAAPRASVMKHAARNPAFALQLWTRAADELNEAHDHMMLLGRHAADTRVWKFLSNLSNRQGTRALILEMTRQDIADHLGLTIETVSRSLARLQSRGVLSIGTPRQIMLSDCTADATRCPSS